METFGLPFDKGEEFHIRKRVVEVEVDLRKEEVELDDHRMYRSQRCPARAPRSGTPAREED